MSEVERYLIGSVLLGKTKSGKITAELYSTDKRLEYPVLVLFDLSMLEEVGIDPNTLGDEPVYKRFWAYYTESEKTTSQGRSYRDVQYLELVDNGSPAPSAGNSAMLTELRAIRCLLEELVKAVGGNVDEPAPPIETNEDPPQEQQGNSESVLDAFFSEGNGVPTSPRELMQILAEQDYEYSSARVLHDALADQFGDSWRGWPPASDLDAWSHITKTALRLAEV